MSASISAPTGVAVAEYRDSSASPDDRDAVLLVDDQPETLAALQTFFRRRKINVLTATSVTEALAVIETNRERLHLIITDWDVPEDGAGSAVVNAAKRNNLAVMVNTTEPEKTQAHYDRTREMEPDEIYAKGDSIPLFEQLRGRFQTANPSGPNPIPANAPMTGVAA